jgi:hypothetical protein
MIDDEILNSLLDTSVKKAMEKIKDKQAISAEEAIPLLLKSQFNHIAHLDQSIQAIQKLMGNMATKDDIKRIDERFEKMDERFERVFNTLQNNMIWTISTIIAVASIIFGMVKFT